MDLRDIFPDSKYRVLSYKDEEASDDTTYLSCTTAEY